MRDGSSQGLIADANLWFDALNHSFSSLNPSFARDASPITPFSRTAALGRRFADRFVALRIWFSESVGGSTKGSTCQGPSQVRTLDLPMKPGNQNNRFLTRKLVIHPIWDN